MQCTHVRMRDFKEARKKIRICKRARDLDNPAFGQLLAASKDAEALIGCLFELHFITAAPLRQIWDKLAIAIEAAQRSQQTQP